MKKESELMGMNRTVLITGSSRGIGRAIARSFAKQGDRVVINYLKHREAAEKLKDEIVSTGGQAIAIGCDVSDEVQVKNMIKKIEQEFSPVDILINNAGISETKLFTDIETGMWERIFDVNVKGTYLCSKYVVPGMISRKKGKIINISSIFGLVGGSCEVHYSAAKGAIIAFTKALAKEEAPSNIQVNAVAPGAIYTDMLAGLDDDSLQIVIDETPSGRLGKPEDIAETVLFLASERADFITGQVISPNGGFVIY